MTDIKQQATDSLSRQQDHNTTEKTKDKVVAIKNQLQEMKPLLQQAMLKKMKPEYLISVATTILRTRPELQECSPLSLISAIFQSAQTGLSLDPVLKHASLVSRWNGKTKQKEAQFMPEFRGYQELARRSGEIVSLMSQLRYEKDFFEIEYGSNEHLSHRIADGDRGKLLGVYSYAKFKSGGFVSEYMTVEEIKAIERRSSSKDKDGNIVGPWKTDWNEMARKTTVRRLSKYLPLSTELAVAVQADEIIARGITPNIDQTTGAILADFVDEPPNGTPVPELPAKVDPGASPEPGIGEQQTAAMKKLIAETKFKKGLDAVLKAIETHFSEGNITEAQHSDLVALVGKRVQEIGGGK